MRPMQPRAWSPSQDQQRSSDLCTKVVQTGGKKRAQFVMESQQKAAAALKQNKLRRRRHRGRIGGEEAAKAMKPRQDDIS